MRKISPFYFTFLLTGVVVSGSVTGLLVRWLALLKAEDDTHQVSNFHHSIFVSWFTMLGYSLSWFVYKGNIWYKTNYLKVPLIERVDIAPSSFTFRNYWAFVLCGVLESSYNLLIVFGSNMINASTAVVLRVSSVMYSMFLAKTFLHQQFHNYQYFGASVVMCGLIVVFLAVFLSESTGTQSNPTLGSFLVLFGYGVGSASAIIQEKSMVYFGIPPTMFAGIRGLCGICILGVLLLFFQTLPEASNPDRMGSFLAQVSDNSNIAWMLAGQCVSSGVLDITGSTLIEAASAATYAVVSLLRIVTVWIVSLAWSSFTGEQFDAVKALGFAILVVGVLLYRNIIPIPSRVWECVCPTVFMSPLPLHHGGEGVTPRQPGHVILNADLVTHDHLRALTAAELSEKSPSTTPSSAMSPEATAHAVDLHTHTPPTCTSIFRKPHNRVRHQMLRHAENDMETILKDHAQGSRVGDVFAGVEMNDTNNNNTTSSSSPPEPLALKTKLHNLFHDLLHPREDNLSRRPKYVLSTLQKNIKAEATGDAGPPPDTPTPSGTSIQAKLGTKSSTDVVRTIVVPFKVFHKANQEHVTLGDTVLAKKHEQQHHHI